MQCRGDSGSGEAGQAQVEPGFQVGAGVAGSGAWQGESTLDLGRGERHVSPWVPGVSLASTTPHHSTQPLHLTIPLADKACCLCGHDAL